MNKIKISIIIFAMVCLKPVFSLEDSIVAIVNDRVILKSELENRLQQIDISNLSRIQLSKIKNDILEKLIEESLMNQASERLGINVSDIDLQNQIRSIAKREGLTVLQLKEKIENSGLSYINYLEIIRKNIKRQELLRTQFTNRAYVSEEEINSFIQNNTLPELSTNINLQEYIIKDKHKKLNLSQAKILFDGIRLEDGEKNNTKYPDYDIEISVMSDIQISKLPDIYQNNLQVLDENNFTKTFQTGKGFTMLKVLKSNMFIDEYKVSHILMRTNPMEGTDKVKEKFYKIKKEVLDGNDFSDYAKKYSLDKTSAIKGGSLGWITKESVVDNFRRVMVDTPIGEISEPFKTQYGWHILYLEDKRTKNMYSDIQRNQVISILKDRKVLVAKKEWLSKLRDQAYIKITQ